MTKHRLTMILAPLCVLLGVAPLQAAKPRTVSSVKYVTPSPAVRHEVFVAKRLVQEPIPAPLPTPLHGPIQSPFKTPVQALVQKPIQGPHLVCKTPCITYKQHGRLRKTCCGCTGTHTALLHVEDPCTCCLYEIPVCLPDCCEGEPRIHGRLNALGRGAIVYHWCCGYKVKLIFDRCGDVTVHMIGR